MLRGGDEPAPLPAKHGRELPLSGQLQSDGDQEESIFKKKQAQ